MADTSLGGAYLPRANYTRTGATDTGGTYAGATLTSPSISSPTITGTPSMTTAVLTASGACGDRVGKVGVKAIAGASLHAGVLAWQNPESGDILIDRILFDVTTVATGACTTDIGTTAVSATTASDNLIDGLDVNAATGVFDNITDEGTNGKSRQRIASGKWVTFKEASGDATGLVANAYISYVLA